MHFDTSDSNTALADEVAGEIAISCHISSENGIPEPLNTIFGLNLLNIVCNDRQNEKNVDNTTFQ